MSVLIQNKHHPILSQTKERLALYRSILQKRLDRAKIEPTALKVPCERGLRLRLAGKPFHSTPEFFFQEGGRIHFELPHETMVVGPGEGMLIPAQMPHGERWSGKDFLTLIVVFHSESFFLHLGYLENGKGPICCGPIDRLPSGGRFDVIRYAEEMASAPGTDSVSRNLRHGLYIALLARLIQGLRPSRLVPQPPSDRLSRCSEMIEFYSCRMDFSVTWLAKELGCSPDNLSRRFRAHTGFRIMEAVHRRRVDQARRLLHDSDMNIAEIAWACGFSQPSYFNHVFKTLTGITPKTFREGNSPRID